MQFPLLLKEAATLARGAADAFCRHALCGFLSCVVVVDLETGRHSLHGFFDPARADVFARGQERLDATGALRIAAFTFVCPHFQELRPAADRA